MKAINRTIKNNVTKNGFISAQSTVGDMSIARKNLCLKNPSTVYFGTNPTYLYGHIYKNKFMTPYKGYSIVEELHDACSGAVISNTSYFSLFKLKYNCALGKLVNGEISLFFSGSIFNTFVISVEEAVSTLFSCDGKLTVIKELLEVGRIYVVRVVKENEKRREVKLADVYTGCSSAEHNTAGGVYPGLVLTGTVEFVSNKPFVTTPVGNGPIILQNNEISSQVKCVLYSVGSILQFAQVGNPISTATVRSITSLNSIKVVEDGNIRGILLSPSHNSDVYDVVVERILIGSYIFVEGIRKTSAVVKLIKKVEGDGTCPDGRSGVNELIGPFWEVSYKIGNREYLGICRDKKVRKKMKGRIIKQLNIGDYKYEFTQSESGISAASINSGVGNTTNTTASTAVTNNPHTNDGNSVTVDQLINQISTLTTYQQILKLLNTYILIVDNPDELCIIYLKKLEEMGEINNQEINKILKIISKKGDRISSDTKTVDSMNVDEYSKASQDDISLQNSKKLTYTQFIDRLIDELENVEALKYLYEKRSSKKGFKRILKKLGDDHGTIVAEKLSFDQIDFIMQNTSCFNFAIEFIYESIRNPADAIQKIMGLDQKWIDCSPHPDGGKANAHHRLDSFKNWQTLLKHEKNKSDLFEAALGKGYSKIEMKQIFSKWYDFENSINGDIERVKELARKYKEKCTQ